MSVPGCSCAKINFIRVLSNVCASFFLPFFFQPVLSILSFILFYFIIERFSVINQSALAFGESFSNVRFSLFQVMQLVVEYVTCGVFL